MRFTCLRPGRAYYDARITQMWAVGQVTNSTYHVDSRSKYNTYNERLGKVFFRTMLWPVACNVHKRVALVSCACRRVCVWLAL
jgi:hypothetical protein